MYISFNEYQVWQLCCTCTWHLHTVHRLLLAASTSIRSQYVMVRKMKAIYHILNQFNQRDGGRVLIGECWMPTADIPNIRCPDKPRPGVKFLAVDH